MNLLDVEVSRSKVKVMVRPYVVEAYMSMVHNRWSAAEWFRNAQSLMHRHLATICSRIVQFSPKCSEKITVYQSMQNLYHLVTYSCR